LFLDFAQTKDLVQGSQMDFLKRGKLGKIWKNFCQKRGKLKEMLEFLRGKSGEKAGKLGTLI
jgi:hypothetical protein